MHHTGQVQTPSQGRPPVQSHTHWLVLRVPALADCPQGLWWQGEISPPTFVETRTGTLLISAICVLIVL